MAASVVRLVLRVARARAVGSREKRQSAERIPITRPNAMPNATAFSRTLHRSHDVTLDLLLTVML